MTHGQGKPMALFTWPKTKGVNFRAATKVNGQCLHATRRAHFGAQAVKEKLYYVHCLDRLASHLAEFVQLMKECNPMLVEFRLLQPWPQIFVSTESIDLIIPRVRPPSQRSVSNRWIPSKNSPDPAMFR